MVLASDKTTSAREILVVDDHDDSREMLSRLLRRHGYFVVEAENGARALELAVRFNPSLVLLDNMMPGMSGLEVLESLRSSPRLAGVPVVMFSADLEIRDAALRLGADDTLPKGSVGLEQLFEVVQRYAGAPEKGRSQGQPLRP